MCPTHSAWMYIVNYFQGIQVESLLLLVIAIAIDACFGNVQYFQRMFQHPVVIIGAFTKFLDEKLNRERRSERDRAIRGGLSVLIMTSVVIMIGFIVGWVSTNYPIGWILELSLLVLLLAGRELYDSVNNVKKALDAGNLEGGRIEVAHIVGRDPKSLDQHAVARAAIESLAENFADAVVAPTFWFVLFGLPGLLVSKAINTMDSMVGYKTKKYKAFGMAPARFDDILNFIPARAAGAMIAVAAIFAVHASPIKSIKAMFKDGPQHRSFNAGWPESAMAGALDIALAGPRRYGHETIEDKWMGTGTARVTSVHIAKALYIYLIANLINVGLVVLLVFGLTSS